MHGKLDSKQTLSLELDYFHNSVTKLPFNSLIYCNGTLFISISRQ